MKRIFRTIFLGFVGFLPNGAYSQSSTDCPLGDLPSITFKGNAIMLSADSKAMLSVISDKLKSAPKQTILIGGHSVNSKHGQSLCNKRLEVIQQYLLQEGNIVENRMSVLCDAFGDENTIDIYDPKCGPSNTAKTTDGTLQLGTTSTNATPTEKAKSTTTTKNPPVKAGKKKKHK